MGAMEGILTKIAHASIDTNNPTAGSAPLPLPSCNLSFSIRLMF